MKKSIVTVLFLAAAMPLFAQRRVDFILDLEGVHRQNQVRVISNGSPAIIPEFRNGGGVGGGVNWFFTDRVSLETKVAGLVGGTRVRVIAGDFVGVAELGNTQIYPISAILQWHLLEHGTIRPYIGAGVTYTVLRNISEAIGASGATGIKFKDPVGLTVDGGLELHLSKRWSIYGDARYVPVESTATANFPGTATRIELDVKPLIVSAGIAWRR